MTVFIHCSCINHWQEILVEQMSHLSHGLARVEGSHSIHINLTGRIEDRQRVFAMQIGRLLKCPVQVQNTCHDTALCETPTIDLMDKFARKCPSREYILYLHSKGVAHPNSLYRTLWRWHMNYYLIDNLPAAQASLCQRTPWAASAARNENLPCPHAAGNYFLTTASFLQSLPPFMHYRDELYRKMPKVPDFFETRHADEMWLGSTYCHGSQLAPLTHEPWKIPFWSSNPELVREMIRSGS
jgi:hypothetical protein